LQTVGLSTLNACALGLTAGGELACSKGNRRMTQMRGDGVGQWRARQRETARARSALDAQTAGA